ncbi:MAG: DNA adenine methylase [Promethearchaeota archaeon]
MFSQDEIKEILNDAFSDFLKPNSIDKIEKASKLIFSSLQANPRLETKYNSKENFFKYPGNKINLIKRFGIHEYFPKINHDHHYVELFAGSGSLFFKLKPLYAIINDYNGDLINFWRVIKDQYEVFRDRIRFLWSGIQMNEIKDDVDRAIKFYLDINIGIMKFPKPMFLRKDLLYFKNIMDNCRLLIYNKDALELLEKLNKYHQSEQSRKRGYYYVIYEDPPYIGSEKVYSGMINSDNKGVFDHIRLSELNHESPHHIILSYPKCDFVDDYYSDWYRVEFASRSYISYKEFTEVLLSNRPLIRNKKNRKLSEFMK